MAYIYMDESGDLGFNMNYWNSKYFLITFLISNSEDDVIIVMKNVYKWMAWKKLKRKWSFFHSNKESVQSVKRALDLASRRDFVIVSLIVNKQNVPYEYKKNQHILYNNAVKELLFQCEKRGYINSRWPVHFIASRKETNKYLNNKFIETVKSAVSRLIKFDVKIKSPESSKWLELVDAISFSLFQKYEKSNFDLYSVIKNKIILEKQIF